MPDPAVSNVSFGPFAVGIAFWVFVAIAAVASLWRQFATRRETERTIRLAIEKGQQLDPALIEQLLQQKPEKHKSDGLLIGGLIVLASGLGLPILGFFIGLQSGKPIYPLMGAGALVALVGAAMLLAWRLIRKREQAEEAQQSLPK